MANRTITIYCINDDDTLTLTDNGVTKAKLKDKIIWEIHKDSNVEEIIAIERKPYYTEIFISPPAQVGSSKKWGATIRSTMKRKKTATTYNYSITYTKKGVAGYEFIHDPTIQINSKK